MSTVKRIAQDWEEHQRSGKENPYKDKPWGWQWGTDAIVAEVDALLPEHSIRNPVLEIGCGGGKWTKWLCDRVERVCAVDVHETAIKESARYEPRAEYRLSDGEQIPARRGEFDTIFTWDTLLHLPMPLVEQYFLEANRVARRCFIFALPNITTRRGSIMFVDAVKRNVWRDPYCYGYMNYYHPHQVMAMLSIAGWRHYETLGDVGHREPRDMVYLCCK